MYLIKLNDEKKKLFLGLAYNLASADGNFSEEEHQMIKSYFKEMEKEFDLNEINTSMDYIINNLYNTCDITEKKIIIFEALGLALVDGTYDTSERSILENVSEKLGLSEKFTQDCEKILREYIEFQKKINQMIVG